MVEIDFDFPVKEDAHKMHQKISKFFQGSKAFSENYILINPIERDDSNPNRPIWHFYIDISTGESDNEIEKYVSISGGQLNLMNGLKHVWAFS